MENDGPVVGPDATIAKSRPKAKENRAHGQRQVCLPGWYKNHRR